MSTTSYLKVNNFSKVIKKTLILDDITLNLDNGKIYGFKGKNGSGKTMLLRAICGLIKPTSGSIEVNGKILGQDISFPENTGAIIEYPGFLPNLTGCENLEIIAKMQNKITRKDINEILSKVGLDPNDKKKVKKYSLGMKQKLGIAQALMEDPELIILDEPTNALDADGVAMIKELLIERKQIGKLILIASHDKEDLELLSDEIFTIENGKIVNHELLEEC